MKTERSVHASYAGAIRHARAAVRSINDLLPATGTGPYMHPGDMAELRLHAERLLQRIHDMSAYRNVLETE